MWTCPVCNQQSDTLLCENCGFDGSCDLEHYPTLAVPSALPRSIQKQKQQYEWDNKNLLRCPECEGDQFRFHLADGAFICLNCRHHLPLSKIGASMSPTPVKKPAPVADPSIRLYNQGHGQYYRARNYILAAESFRKSAELGKAAAQHSLGYCFQYGQGVARNPVKAVEYYQLAANQGHSGAQFNLGYCYYMGQGVPVNYTKAAEYFHKAADQGNASAQVWLGGCYYHGRGVPQSYEKAAEYYRRAANQNVPYAHQCLGDCYKHGHGVPQDMALAAKHFQKITSVQH